MIFPTPAPRRRLIRLDTVGQFSFELPETLPSTATELSALLAQAQADIRVIQARHEAGQTLSTTDATELRTLLAGRTAVKAELAKVNAEAAEINDLLTQAASDEGGTEAQATDAAEVEPEAEPADAAGGVEAAQAVVTEAAPAMAAAGQGAPPAPVTFAGAGRNTGPTLITRGEPGWLMHQGAPGYRPDMGKVGFKGISEALETMKPGSRTSFQPNRPNRTLANGMSYARQVIASLGREGQVVADDSHSLVAAINAATSLLNGSRVTAAALTAAGGWCAPSEQLYDFCDVAEASDLVSLPEVTINRGGLRWPREPDLSGIFEDFEWFFTETQLEAVDGEGNPTAIKQCVEIPCADTFDEIRLNAVGWCVESGILQEQGWPELSEWFMRQLTQEHLRALSRRSILNVVSGSGSAIVIPPTTVLGSAASVLNSLALMATNIRLKRGLGRSAIIEGIAPSWFFEVLRADLAMRQGSGADVFNVTDGQISAWLTARNIALQFVGDWQTRSTGLPGDLATTTWPGTVDVVLYPAGTWFRSMAPVIELGVMYPKEQLQVNRFTRLFTEDSMAVGKRCGESVLTRIPLNTSGEVGARRQITITPGNKTVSLATTGTPTGGTFTVKLGGRETGTIAFGASAATIKTALVALDDAFTNADFTTSGGALPTAVSITFPSVLGSLVLGTNSLTGGTSPNVSIA